MSKPILVRAFRRPGTIRPHFVHVGRGAWRAYLNAEGKLFGEGSSKRLAADDLQTRLDAIYERLARSGELTND